MCAGSGVGAGAGPGECSSRLQAPVRGRSSTRPTRPSETAGTASSAPAPTSTPTKPSVTATWRRSCAASRLQVGPLERALRASSVWAALMVVRVTWGDGGEPQARLKSRWGHAYVQQLREEPSCPQEDVSFPSPGRQVPVWTSGKAFGGQRPPGVAGARCWAHETLGFVRAALLREYVPVSSGGEFLLSASRREPLPRGSLRPRVL